MICSARKIRFAAGLSRKAEMVSFAVYNWLSLGAHKRLLPLLQRSPHLVDERDRGARSNLNNNTKV
jgi:hypothetical protein